MCRNIANNIHFHYRTNSVKIKDKIFQYIQKTLFLALFWPIFPIFGAKNFFLENPALSRTTSYGFLASCQNLEKTNNTIPRKRLDRWKDGRKDGRMDRPYFTGPFQLTPGVQLFNFIIRPHPVKPLNSGNLQVLKNLSFIKRCPLLGGSLKKIVTFRTKHFVRYSRHVRYMGCTLLGGFTTTTTEVINFKTKATV